MIWLSLADQADRRQNNHQNHAPSHRYLFDHFFVSAFFRRRVGFLLKLGIGPGTKEIVVSKPAPRECLPHNPIFRSLWRNGNPASEPRYVWHCHDDEGNEMMRSYKIMS